MLSDDELQAMIDEFDKVSEVATAPLMLPPLLTRSRPCVSMSTQNQDGVIDQEEFLAIMKQTSIY